MELARAELIIGLADRWHQLPETIENLDARTLRMLDILRRGKPEEVNDAE